jgi:hypothetical protein
MIALNEWLLSGTRILNLSARVWAKADIRACAAANVRFWWRTAGPLTGG